MNYVYRIRAVVTFAVLLSAAYSQAAPKEPNLPHLQKRGQATQLIVDGKPFLVLGGELHNSSASSLTFMKPIWSRLSAMHLNTVLLPIAWEQFEPEEGKFDFALIDGLLRDARQNHLRLVLLWFGSWKNTYSSYVPLWVKRDVDRFPRVETRDHRGTERLSPFSDPNRNADARAFAALMRHLKETDSDAHTVLMVQVENEVGVIPDSRDRSAVADKAFSAPVPKELTQYLQQHRNALIPELRAIWEAGGAKTSGTWQEVFGSGNQTDDLFMAWHYARYINDVTAAGKKEYPLPMFVNAALIRPNYQPGQYNSGGPLPHSMDIWRAGAPAVDFLAPDIYFDNFAEWAQKYNRSGNPLFIPEALSNSAPQNVFYAFGQQQAFGFSPFGIDGEGEPDESSRGLAASYATLTHLAPLILEKQSEGKIACLILENEAQPTGRISLGDYTMNATRAIRTPSPEAARERAAAIILQMGPDEYLIAGSGSMNISFSSNSPGLPIVGVGSIDEETLIDGQWTSARRLNGDENAQGQLLRLNGGARNQSVIYHVHLYRYR
jgi:beta-galactosidase GanA